MTKVIRNNIAYLWCLLLLGAFNYTLTAQSGLQAEVDKLKADPGLSHGQLGIYIYDLDKKEILAKCGEETSLIPASSQKLITTAAALFVFGPDHRFSTDIKYSGEIVDGVLKGNLYICGNGDPSLGAARIAGNYSMDEVLDTFVKAIREAGITRIEGDVVGDDAFGQTATHPETWQWRDIGNYYGAPVCGLNLNENMYVLTFSRAAKAGQRPEVSSVKPDIPNYTIVNEVISTGPSGGDEAYVFLPLSGTKAFVRGSIPSGKGEFQIKGAVPDPPLFAAYHLRNRLTASGVSVKGEALCWQTTTIPAERKLVYSYKSPTMAQLIQRTNQESVNLYAETLLRDIGLKLYGDAAADRSAEGVKSYWKSRGVPAEGWFMEDGCGLSARNGISARQFVEILKVCHQDTTVFPCFLNSLAVAGKSGTLKSICAGTCAEGAIFAKSGSINRVRTYTGYARTKSGHMLAFSFMANNFTSSDADIKKKFARLMELMAGLE